MCRKTLSGEEIMNQTNSSNAITQLTTKMERGELGKKADGSSSFSLVFMMLISIFIIFSAFGKIWRMK